MFEERRRTRRCRVIYGGVIAFNERQSTMDCIVKNFSEAGAKVVFGNSALLPDRVDLVIERKGRAYLARIVWRGDLTAGFEFQLSRDAGDPVSLDLARRLRDGRRKQKSLQNRINQLTSGF